MSLPFGRKHTRWEDTLYYLATIRMQQVAGCIWAIGQTIIMHHWQREWIEAQSEAIGWASK